MRGAPNITDTPKASHPRNRRTEPMAIGGGDQASVEVRPQSPSNQAFHSGTARAKVPRCEVSPVETASTVALPVPIAA